MYRILSASKDTYITSKIIAGERCTTSNVGQAATLDLYKLFDQTTVISASTVLSGVIELSRLLIKFDYDTLQQITGSYLNINDSTFKAYLSLKDVYGGQTTPSNYTIRLCALSSSWDEGRGSDVISYRDLDTVNFLSSSSGTAWFGEGASISGTLNSTGIDIITSGNLGSGTVDLTVSQRFARGDEDLLLDVTTLVSAAMVGQISNHGWRLSFADFEETNNNTYFVKRFGTKQAQSTALRPQLIIKYNDQIQDDSGNAMFNVSQSLFTYNRIDGVTRNFMYGSTEITGANCLILNLYANKYYTYTTNSWSPTHSASINHLTRSLLEITQSFSGSQVSIGGILEPGIYSADVNLNTITNSTLKNFLSGSKTQEFRYEWLSIDQSFTYSSGKSTWKLPQGSTSNFDEENWVVNVTNLKQQYKTIEKAKLRLFILDYNTEQAASRIPLKPKSMIFDNIMWQIRKAYTGEIIIPFDDSATLCSYDGEGMYFNLWMQDLAPGEVYELNFLINHGGRDCLIDKKGFIFKVMI
jgi:hypothetical protein